MKKILLILAIFALVFSCASCKEEEGREILDDVDIEFLEDDSLDFSVTVPEDWEKTHSSYMGSEIRHYTAGADDTKDDYFESISITTEKVEETLTLDSYVDTNLESLEMFYGDFKIISDKESVEIDGLDAVRVVYSYSMGTFSVVTEQVFVMKDSTVYNVVCIAEEENLEKYQDIFKKAWESFKIN